MRDWRACATDSAAAVAGAAARVAASRLTLRAGIALLTRGAAGVARAFGDGRALTERAAVVVRQNGLKSVAAGAWARARCLRTRHALARATHRARAAIQVAGADGAHGGSSAGDSALARSLRAAGHLAPARTAAGAGEAADAGEAAGALRARAARFAGHCPQHLVLGRTGEQQRRQRCQGPPTFAHHEQGPKLTWNGSQKTSRSTSLSRNRRFVAPVFE